MPEASALESFQSEMSALAGSTGPGRLLLLESLLSRMSDLHPEVTRVVAAALAVFEADEGDGARDGLRLHREVERNTERSPKAKLDSRTVVDCFIVCPKIVEEAATKAAFALDHAREVYSPRLRQAGVLAECDGRSILLCSPKRDGNTGMALYTEEWLSGFSPRVGALVGMAGGRTGRVKLGDVVLGEMLFDYQFARLSVDSAGQKRKENRFLAFQPADALIRDIPGMDTADWREGVVARSMDAAAASGAKTPSTTAAARWKPSLKAGGILAGSHLFEDGSIEEVAASHHDRAIAVEMEGAGFVAACLSRNVPWLTLRGIADLGEAPEYGKRRRGKDWQFVSTFAAADMLRAALGKINVLQLEPSGM